MFKRTLISATIVAIYSVANSAWAAEAEQVQQQVQKKEQVQQQTNSREQIYGSQLMTQQERIEHRNKLRTAKTAEEREQIRAEHHAQMLARAKEGLPCPTLHLRLAAAKAWDLEWVAAWAPAEAWVLVEADRTLHDLTLHRFPASSGDFFSCTNARQTLPIPHQHLACHFAPTSITYCIS